MLIFIPTCLITLPDPGEIKRCLAAGLGRRPQGLKILCFA